MKGISEKCNRIRQWFIKLGFWKKLILIFTINTVIILIVMNALMEVLFAKVNHNISSISQNETKQYISISNSLVGVSVANSLLVGLGLFSDFIVQVDSSVHFFRNNANIYQSLQSGISIYNPPLVTQIDTVPNFRKPGMLFYSQNSTFHNDPYVDVLFSSLFSSIEEPRIKRMNIIYQSLTNPSDIFVKTTPGTNSFIVPSIDDINKRFSSLNKDFVTITSVYNDTLTSNNTFDQLFALRTLQFQQGFQILIEIQIYQATISEIFSKLYYYPSTQIVLFKILSQNPPQYQLMNVDSFDLDLSNCFMHNVYEFNLPNGTNLNAYSIAINQTFQIGQSPFIIPYDKLIMMNSTVGSFRLVLLVDKEQLSIPNNFMTGFLSRQSSTLSYVIYGWSFIILLATVGLSIVTGNYIFYNLKTLSEKLQEYTKSPSKISKVILELKELQCTGIIKKLIDNVVTVIQKIQERKKNKNQIISPRIYPLNIAEKQFVNRHNIDDQEKWERWKQLLQKAQQKIQNNPTS